MTFSELFMLRNEGASTSHACPVNRIIRAVTAVTRYSRMPGHHRGRLSRSPYAFEIDQSSQQLPAVAPAEHAGRRVGAGAGATPVFVALIRHDTFLVRWRSLVGRSRTCPSILIANLNAIRNGHTYISKE
jgi:hypothetical protein